jgi:hypothetical protein
MHEIRPDTRTKVLIAVIGAIMSLIGYLRLSRSLTSGVGIEWGAFFFSLFFFILSLWGVLCLLTGLPYLRWNERLIVYTGVFGREHRYLFAEFGPVMAAMLPGYRGNTNSLCLRPLSGGKTVWIPVPNQRMKPEEVVSLAETINLARGLPPGTTDPVAIVDIQKAKAAVNRWVNFAVMFGTLIAFFIFFWWPRN